MTYLEIVNKVLRRLREDEVTAVNQSAYSRLIGDYVNAMKREVEDSFNWSALRQTLTAQTTVPPPEIFNFSLVGAGTRFRVLDVINDTSNWFMEYRDSHWFNRAFLTTDPQVGSPFYYNFNGVDVNGDAGVDVYPIPDGVYDIRFNLVVPQAELESDSTRILVPWQPVMEGALARSINERGEDGATGSDFQWEVYRRTLADFIAMEANRVEEEMTWKAV